MRPKKLIRDSRTEQVHIVMPASINGQGRLFGGALMQWIDVVAGVVARRHSGMNVTTAVVDQLTFLRPAQVNDIITCIGTVTYVGNSSMEVRVDSFVEGADGNRTLTNRAYLVMVALDENNVPHQVPELILETDDERAEWENAELRQRLRESRRRHAL